MPTQRDIEMIRFFMQEKLLWRCTDPRCRTIIASEEKPKSCLCGNKHFFLYEPKQTIFDLKQKV